MRVAYYIPESVTERVKFVSNDSGISASKLVTNLLRLQLMPETLTEPEKGALKICLDVVNRRIIELGL